MGIPSTTGTDSRYTVISADTHAGGSHASYREFLESKYHDDFDAWRGKYKNPYKDLGDNRRLPELPDTLPVLVIAGTQDEYCPNDVFDRLRVERPEADTVAVSLDRR